MLRIFRNFNVQRLEGILGRKVLKRDLSEFIVLSFIIIYTIVFSYYTITKHYAFRTFAWDLGIFNQALWNTVNEGKLFYYTVELFVNPSGNFFGSHFSPALFFVLPVYYLFPAPETLLIFQSFVLAIGAIPLYFYIRKAVDHRIASIAFALAYLVYPPLHGVNWFDFHVQAFLPVFLFSAMYFLRNEKWIPYFGFIFLSLTVAESVPFVVSFMGLYCFWVYRRQVIQTIKKRNLNDKRILVPFLTVTIALLWFFFALWIRQTYFPTDPDYSRLYKAVDNWSVLGIQDDPAKLPLHIILHPLRAFDAIAFDAYLKLLFIILLFGSLRFYSWSSMISMITLVWLVPALLSNYPPYYLIGNHFPAYIIPFIFLAAVEAISKSSIRKQNNGTIVNSCKNILILSLLFAFFVSPISPLLSTIHTTIPTFADYQPPRITNHEVMLKVFVDIIPLNASVLTQNNIFPHVSSRLNAFVYPIQVVLDRSPPKIDVYINDLFLKAEFVLVDNVTDRYMANLAIKKIEESQNHGLYAFTDGIYLFKKGYQDLPKPISDWTQ